MLLINNNDVAALLTIEDCIEAQEAAFRELATGRAIHRPRVDLMMPAAREDGYFRGSTMEGAYGGVYALRLKSDIIVWPHDADGGWTEEKYCVEPGTFCGLVLLFSTDNGEPLAIINDGVIQHMRVGAAAGIGAKYLSRPESRSVGMLGSGGMARTYLEAFCRIREIDSARVYSPTRAHREAYAVEMSTKLGITVTAVDTPKDATVDADILATCTDSMIPVLDADMIEPGMHVTNLGRREISDAAMDRFDVVIRQGTAGIQLPQTDRFKAEVSLSPAAYIGGTEEEMRRLPPKNPEPGFGGDSPDFHDRGRGGDRPDFAALVSGKAEGRTGRDQVTFYRNVGNQGLQFAALGGLVYRKARDRGRGHQIPTGWFLQDIRD